MRANTKRVFLGMAISLWLTGCGKEATVVATAPAQQAVEQPSGPAGPVDLAIRKLWRTPNILDPNHGYRDERLLVTANKLKLETFCLWAGQANGTNTIEVPFDTLSPDTIRVNESVYSTSPWFTSASGTVHECRNAFEAGIYKLELQASGNKLALRKGNSTLRNYDRVPTP